ncbi:MAG TPA: DUF192 domain-containing protein [Gaiellaceae bacterium]|nr:DUF192 domain-containing protein [Gaiellaceae bacterium]
MTTRVLLLVLLVAAVAGCGGGGNGGEAERTTTATATGPVFERGTVVIESGSGEVEVAVEIAETPVQQQLGLMHRESLAREAGMVFLFAKETRGGFWMKNTLIPLSIAFFDADGRILRILDMEPCEADPCPAYDPETAYRGALEVNKGAFAEWGVSEGDRVRVER